MLCTKVMDKDYMCGQTSVLQFSWNGTMLRPVHTGMLCMHYIAHMQATNIFFENEHLFKQVCEHGLRCRCNCMWRTKFCRFLHEHKGNVVYSLDLFLCLNLSLQTAHQISALKIMFLSTMVHSMFAEN